MTRQRRHGIQVSNSHKIAFGAIDPATPPVHESGGSMTRRSSPRTDLPMRE
jgi:hypothetical protein